MNNKIKKALQKGFNQWREKGGNYWDAMAPEIQKLLTQVPCCGHECCCRKK